MDFLSLRVVGGGVPGIQMWIKEFSFNLLKHKDGRETITLFRVKVEMSKPVPDGRDRRREDRQRSRSRSMSRRMERSRSSAKR